MPLVDQFAGKPQLDGPANNADEIAPADEDLGFVTRSLYIGGAGNVSLVMLGGQTVVFQNVPAGTQLPVRAKRVNAATTATLIVGMW
jgi:hypothetical protein